MLNIQPGESWLVGWMLVYAFFMGAPALITETAAYSLFLAQFNAQAIPYVYIGFAIFTTASGFVYTFLEKRVSFSKFATINLLFLTLTLLLFRLLLWSTGAKWPVMGLAVWYEVSWALATLGFWSLATRLFTIRQSKRLFALIGVGLTLSESVVGFFIPTFVRWVGTVNLLFIAVASFTVALIVQTYILRSYTTQRSTPDDEDDSEETKSESSLTDLFKNRYIVLIFAFAALYALTFYALDNAFYDRVEAQYSDTDQVASFLGVFFGLSGLLTMIVGALISGQLINRYGLRFGLLVMPVTIMIGAASISVVGTLFEAIVILFWLVVITKLLNEVLAYTINRAAWQVLYEPLRANQRLRAQTVVESMVKPIAGGLAGVLLLALNIFFKVQALQIAYLLLFIIAAWLGVVVMLNRTYPSILLRALVKRRLSPTSLSIIDKSSITILKQGLNSPHVGAVIYSLNMLEKIEPESLPIFLQDLLGHPMDELRLNALCKIEQFEMSSITPAIRYRIKYDASPSVRGASLRTLAILDDSPQAAKEIYTYLKDPNRQVRLGAMAGLLRYQERTDKHVAGLDKMLTGLVNSPNPTERVFAAQVLGEAGIPILFYHLLKLLRDDTLEVRQAALVAAKRLHHPKIWPAVVENLALPKARAIAMSALVAGGLTALPALKEVLTRVGQDKEILIRLIRVCARIRGSDVVALLQNYLDFPDTQVRLNVLTALAKCGYQAQGKEKKIIEQEITTEVMYATWILAAMVNLDSNADSLLQAALEGNLANQRARLFLLLSFIYDSQVILKARDTLGLNGTSIDELWDHKRAYALEIIDVTLPLNLKTMLLPLLEHLTPEQRLQRLSTIFPQQRLSCHQYLEEIITGPSTWLDSWTKASALHTVGRLSINELAPVVVSALTAPDLLVRETAVWTLFRLDPVLFKRHINKLAKDSNPKIVKTIKWLETGQRKNKSMLSLLEKVIFLKTVGFFSEVPEDVLVEVASVLEELEIEAGETIIKKGGSGGSLYIIANGKVRVHDERRTITILGQSNVFGEFSVLDSNPRLASVTALENTRLFRLDQDPFFELIDDHSTIARRIMKVLVQYLRQAHNQVNTLLYHDEKVTND